MNKVLLQRIFRPVNIRRAMVERLTEPLHLNLLSLLVAVFGSFRMKVDFDLVLLQHYAFGVLNAADNARRLGLKSVTVLEFGVARGKGIVNLCSLAESVKRTTGVTVNVVGFDGGSGLPDPRDYRDHPEYYRKGEYEMGDREPLLAKLPDNARIIFGDVAETVPAFVDTVSAESPIGFVAQDLDYYWSTKAALAVFEGSPEKYLPTTVIYFDDISKEGHNPWCGELLAANEFNETHAMRKIHKYDFLRNKRIFKNPSWIDHMYVYHVFDHKARSVG